MSVGDHGEGLERRLGKAHGGLEAFDELAHHLVVLGLGGKLVPASHLTNLDPMLGALEIRNQLGKFRLHALAFFTFQRLDDGVQGDGFGRHVNDGLNHRFQRFVIQHGFRFPRAAALARVPQFPRSLPRAAPYSRAT